jgi:hypothetical protein
MKNHLQDVVSTSEVGPFTELLRRPASREIAIEHPSIALVDAEIFTLTFAPDCMTHACRCRDEGDLQKNDACCQHGADMLVPERAAILKRAAEVSSVMNAPWRETSAWFDETDPTPDPEAPGGLIMRTGTADPNDESSGCVFLNHAGPRGCGLHYAALVHGFDPREIKPHVCRLYPLSYDNRQLGLSCDFDRYSCANDDGPTVYRVMRDVIRDIFDDALVEELDRVEASLAKRRLRLLPR